MNKKQFWLILILLFGVNFIVFACTSQNRDLSDFTSFSYILKELPHGQGGDLCAELGILEIHIERTKNGEYQLETTLLAEGIPGLNNCEQEIYVKGPEDIQCAINKDLATRILAPDEVEELLQVFRKVPVYNDYRDDPDMMCDPPCSMETYTWDDLILYENWYCAEPPKWISKRKAINTVLNRLVGLSEEDLFLPRPQLCTTVKNTGIGEAEVYTVDDQGFVWLSTNGILARYNPAFGNQLEWDGRDGLASSRFRKVSVGHDSTVWVTFWDEVGVSVYDGSTWSTLTTEDGLPSNEVFDVVDSNQGIIWFATRSGVASWNPTTDEWRYFGEAEGIDFRPLNLQLAPDGSLWISGYYDAIHLNFNQDQEITLFERYDKESFRNIYTYDHLAVTPEGTVWVDGIVNFPMLAYLRPNTTNLVLTNCCGDFIKRIVPASTGVWVITTDSKGNHRGLIFYPEGEGEDANFVFLDERYGLPSNDVHGIAITEEGFIWVGTDQGLSFCRLE